MYCSAVMDEVWRRSPSAVGYEVSNYGRLRNKHKRVNAPGHEASGYLRASLRVAGRPQSFLMHRLVAEAFLPNPNNQPVVHHKDGIRDNNHVTNLEWVSVQQNAANKVFPATTCARARRVAQIDADGTVIKVWPSLISAAAGVGIQRGNMSFCCRNRHRRAGGFLWAYADDLDERPENEKWASVSVPNGGDCEISDRGVVRTKTGVITPGTPSGNYLCFYGVCVHHLVADAFCPGWRPGFEVNHKDGDTHNNAAVNLEWVSHAENMKHARALGIMANARGKGRAILQHLPDGTTKRYDSIRQAAAATGACVGNIASVCTGKRHTAGGHAWSYVADEPPRPAPPTTLPAMSAALPVVVLTDEDITQLLGGLL